MGYQMKHSLALVVEDDVHQRLFLVMLLEECEMRVLECASAEAAICVLDRMGDKIGLMFTDVQLTGAMNGVTLAVEAKQRFPRMNVVVTSGRACPEGLPSDATFMATPWLPLDVLREAERSRFAD
jgi:DNA-binding NtrC family response regulator